MSRSVTPLTEFMLCETAFGAERFAWVASPTGEFPANHLFFTEKDLA